VTTTATTAYGYDRLVAGTNKGNHGMSTGATARTAYKTHLAKSETRLTACGITIKNSYFLIVPEFGLTGEEWADRLVDCSKCRRHMTAK
jgi:hypothetical protein